jgi:hypothetical protein
MAVNLRKMGDTGLIAETQLCPVFMWCPIVDIGAHHACWLLLQALFMTASVPTAQLRRGQWLSRRHPERDIPLDRFADQTTGMGIALIRGQANGAL